MALVLLIVGVDEVSQKPWIDQLIKSLRHYHYHVML